MEESSRNREWVANRAFHVTAGTLLLASLVHIGVNRLRGLAYFDGSEYALHIAGGGIAHAPGYPLYTVLGKCVHALGADPFLSQQILSMLALVVASIALYKTFALEVGHVRKGLATASTIAVGCLAASYYLRLFSILPEVFVVNVGLFAVLIFAVTRFHHEPAPSKLGPIFLTYGLGLCHHHTLALTLPACVYLVTKRIRGLPALKSILYSTLGFALGCLPLVYLFLPPGEAQSTYYRVHDLKSLLFVLLRQGYGTLHLSPLPTQTDIAGVYSLSLAGILKNFNGLGAVVFAPLLLGLKPLGPSTRAANDRAIDDDDGYRWSSPSMMIALSSLVFFFLFFVPNCNLDLGVRTYRTIFLRFLTVPCFLLVYVVFKAVLRAWAWASAWGRLGQLVVAGAMLFCIVGPAISNDSDLGYTNCDLLDEHVSRGYTAIFRDIDPAPAPFDEGYHQCAIFAQGDTLLMGIKYYNEFLAPRKCYVFSGTSLTGQFLSGRELRLASRTLGANLKELESGVYATRPETLLNLFLKLDRQGYSIFVFSVTDYTGYFSKMFVNSPFAYRPVGNILQVVTQTSAPFGMDKMFASYERYVRDLETYVHKLETGGVPTSVVDSQANQALVLNLTNYAKFSRVYPASPEAVQQLQLRAQSVERKWLSLLPREESH